MTGGQYIRKGRKINKSQRFGGAVARGTPGQTIDLGRLIDERPISRFQLKIFVLCGLVGVLDGLNTQSIGVAARAMASDFHMKVASFGPVFSSMLLGASAGAVLFGLMGDRLGRKQPVVFAVFIIAFFTLLTPFAHSVASLVAVRFLLGLGLGGATPGFLALGSEYAPARLRRRITALLWLGFALGGATGAFLNAYLLTHYRWESIFYTGGAGALFLALLLLFQLPESARFLIARGTTMSKVGAIARRLAPDQMIPTDACFLLAGHGENGDQTEPGGLPRPMPTLMLWASFLMIYGCLSVVTLWSPALLASRGMSAPDTAFVVGFDGLGALVGVGLAGLLLDRFGKPVLIYALVLGAASLAGVGLAGTDFLGIVALIVAAGFFVGVGASGVIALTVQSYPTAARATGLGWAMGAGRFGQFLAPLFVGMIFATSSSSIAAFEAMAALSGAAAIFVLIYRPFVTTREVL